MQGLPLIGLRALVVEDEALVAFLHEETLIGAGCISVTIAATLGAALAEAENETFDVAVLDLNLGGDRSWPVADVLTRRGVPFIICTGYARGYVPEAYADIAVLAKPYMEVEMARAVGAAIGR